MTKIFNNYVDFLNRENKDDNGVNQIFADNNPDWEKQNKTNKGCWNCSRCSDCSGCSRCSDCSGCSRCSDCSGCSRCSDLKNAKPIQSDEPAFSVPKIENIHQKILEAASGKGAFDMSTWHACATTHCRAGWVEVLAGEEGKKLAKQTSTLFAAMLIYADSSPIRVSPVRFYESNEVAMADMVRCADEETKLPK